MKNNSVERGHEASLFAPLTLSSCLSVMARDKPKQAPVDFSSNWHQWRGLLANGLVPKGDPPVKWSETTNKIWMVSIHGTSSATPIVWGNQIFLVSAIKTNRKPKKFADQNQPAERPGSRRFGGFRMSTPTPTTLYQFIILWLDRATSKKHLAQGRGGGSAALGPSSFTRACLRLAHHRRQNPVRVLRVGRRFLL